MIKLKVDVIDQWLHYITLRLTDELKEKIFDLLWSEVLIEFDEGDDFYIPQVKQIKFNIDDELYLYF